MTQELTNILLAVAAVGSLVFSFIVFTIQRRDKRRHQWWAVVEDDAAEKGVAISFRTYRYISKTKPKRKHFPYATVIRGHVLSGESLIGRETMPIMDAIRSMQDRRSAGEKNPELPDEVHPPKITMVPEKVFHYRPTLRQRWFSGRM